MGFDDLFEHNHKHHRHSYDHHSNYGGNYDTHSDHHYENQMNWPGIAGKIRNNPKLKATLILGAIIAVVIAIALFIALLPLIQKFFAFVGEHGIQGVINAIWKGSK